MEKLFLTASDGLDLSVIYSKVSNPKGLVQIIHGMAEHKERYLDFIKFLNDNGYSVIISDLRGHGESINKEYPLGHIDGYEMIINDQKIITDYIKNDNPNVDLYLFGHSMGTLLSRCYLMEHDQLFKKVILSGTVCYTPGAGFITNVAKKKAKKNKYGYSKLLFACSNSFSTKVDFSWLSYSKTNIDNYEKDELCGYKFTNTGYYTLFGMVKALKEYKKYQCKNKELEILSLSGKDDRTTGGTKGLKGVVKILNKIGYKNVSFKEYLKMKHEILNEDDRELVYDDVLKFIEGRE